MEIEGIVARIALRCPGVGNMVVAHAEHNRCARPAEPVDANPALGSEIELRRAFGDFAGGKKHSGTGLNKRDDPATARKVVLQQEWSKAPAEHGVGLSQEHHRDHLDSVLQSPAKRCRPVRRRQHAAPAQVQGPEIALANTSRKIGSPAAYPAPFRGAAPHRGTILASHRADRLL